MNNQEYENFSVAIDDRGVVRISLDVPDRQLNVLNQLVMTELNQIVEQLEQNAAAKIVVIESGKSTGFLAGADVNAIVEIDSPGGALEVLERGQLLFQKIEALAIPTIAVIHGPCLGGGLELCLACDYRIAKDDGSTKIGLPEISLGLIPGWGGTQRLPKLVGLTNSLDLILKGKHVSALDALQMGLVDRLIKPEVWNEGVDEFIRVLNQGGSVSNSSRRGLAMRLIEGNPVGRKLFLGVTQQKIASKAKIYPALNSALKAISSSYVRGEDGYAIEREEFVKLLSTSTCRNLISIFFAREKARNVRTWSTRKPESNQATRIQKVGVVGAGTMGAGIAQLAALRGFDVVVKELNDDAVDAGRNRISGMVNKYAKRKNWSDEKRDRFLDSISVTCDSSALSDSDLVVEAVVERLDVKQSLFGELDSIVQSSAILATNTSSLSVDAMAEGVSRTDKFGGLHFFNPVHRMELVEVVRGKQTNPETIASLVAFVRALGKTPVVTSDSPGFLVNRVLFPYLGEAVLMVREGLGVEDIDRHLRGFGMPMGPLELLDQVGIDVAQHVASSLTSVLRDLEPVPDLLSEMVRNGQLGKKSGIGFYQYSKGKKGKPLSSAASAASAGSGCSDDGLTDIQRRLVYPMLMESIRCLEEHVVHQPWAIDLAMVLGTGFAPHRGGPLHVVDQIGAKLLMTNSQRMSELIGPRFSPPERLVQIANGDSLIFDGNPNKKQKGKVVSH